MARRSATTRPPPRLALHRLVVVCVAIALYLPTLGHGFVFDDQFEIVDNVHVRSADFGALFSSTAWAGAGRQMHLYRPLTGASFALNHALGGPRPWHFHLVNVLLHAMVALLLFEVGCAWGLALPAALGAALLFAVHPLHVEAVANVDGRKDLLMTLFVLATLLGHRRGERHGGAFLVLAPVTFLLALFSKETGATTLALLVVQRLLFGSASPLPTGRRRALVLWTAHALALGAWMVIRYRVVGGLGVPDIPALDNPAAHATLAVRLMTAVAVLGLGLTKLVVPYTLSPDYSEGALSLVTSPLDPRFFATLLLLGGAGALAVRARQRGASLWLGLVLFYGVTVFPTSNLAFPIGTLFGERLLYLPSVAFCLAVTAALWPALERLSRKVAVSVAAAALALLSLRAVTYAASWRDDLSLWTHAARATPGSTKVTYNQGQPLHRAGRPAEALRACERALAAAPTNWQARGLLAQALMRVGRHAEAESSFQNVLSEHPRHVETLYTYGLLRQLRGDLEGAAALWHRALAERPDHGPSLADLGSHALVRGDLVTAQTYWERAVAADPSLASAWHNLGELYERRGEPERAKLAWHRFLAVAGAELAPQRAAVQAKLSRTAP